MPVQVTAIMLGVEDLARSKDFYGEGLGCKIDQDHPNFVSFDLGDGSSSLALYEARGRCPGRGRLVRRIRVSRRVVPSHRLDARRRGRGHREGSGSRRRRRQRGRRRAVGVLRLLRRSGRLPLEGRVQLVIAPSGVLASTSVHIRRD